METNSNEKTIEARLPIKIFNFREDEFLLYETDNPAIVFVQEGEFVLFANHDHGRLLVKGDLLILPVKADISFLTKSGCRFMVWRIGDVARLFRKLEVEGICNTDMYNETGIILPAAEPLRAMLNNFAELYLHGIRNASFTEGKLDELIFLIHTFYSGEIKAGFFSPLMNSDFFFRDRVIKYYRIVSSVDELAEKTNCSRSIFHKRFREVFGESAAQWINIEKSREIRKELKTGIKPFKQIAEDYGFSSISYFNQFCRKNLGDTPGNIRKLSLNP